ncbi:transglycosylase [Mycobacterium sp. Marseille-P9652]|uniref:transglycosylase n=1 Tax=Mycobacterium sp. Marseille-P9652 TaxID=2654950 RepID=UPI0018D054C8|nr:transglycosylase [Mycobacterium sp. Marseille-P9652]
MRQALAALSRGHDLFAGGATVDHLGDTPAQLQALAHRMSRVGMQQLHRMAESDRALAHTMAAARAHHASARTATGAVLEAARSDAVPAADTPIGRREAMSRMAARLRAQHRHIAASHTRARQTAQRLRRLQYPRHHATGRPAVLAAIQRALEIKGIHDPAARARWARGMDLVARRESNYDAGAVNRWDVNASRGTPSRGAWQFIAPTFAAYHQPGTSHNIDDLVAQACAFINYARGHYGVAADGSDLAARIQQADPRRPAKGY